MPCPLFSSVQSFSCVWLFVTLWTEVRQASLFITNSQSLLKLMSIKSVMPSNHLILCHSLLLLASVFPSIRVFSNESLLHIRSQSIGASASASVLPVNIQDWFPLGWTGWISLQSRNSQESSPTPQFKSINSLALSFLYGPTLTYISQYKPLLLIFYVCFGVYVCLITQSCPTFVDSMDYSPPGSSVHGISQARTLE